ncbi:MAG: tetratricopeptide repeat protein [Planctomycetes bacterium]|nr:tetratricopeptide repeat protein [Planctomycetota bacterium]
MPTQFGRYTLEKELGQGGMGIVYLAFDPSLKRHVALKIITSTDKEMLERFQREARAAARLKHPNIAQVYEIGVADKQNFYTMDYIEGTSLEKLIETGEQLDFKYIAHIIYQVAMALNYAHDQKIIHRDIKPANILINEEGSAYIVDFGLAKQLTGLDRSLTMSGSTVGTPDYMSPEQATGDKDIDPRSDIFSLGATLFHCITGKLPFDGEHIYDIFSKILNEEAPAPSSIVRTVPKDLETICLKCMAKEPAKRYQSTMELAMDIQRFLNGEPVLARRSSFIGKVLFRAKKNKPAAIGITSAVLLLLGAGIFLLISHLRAAQKIEEYRANAFKLFLDGKFEDARVLCEKVIDLKPGDKDIAELLDKCKNTIREREEKLKKTQEQAERRAKAKVILDRATGNSPPEQRIKIASEALKADPYFGEAWQVIGYAYKDLSMFDKAFDAFSNAIKLTPTLAYSYYERADITAFKRGQLNESIPDFKKVIELDPNSHIGWFARGEIARNLAWNGHDLKKYDEAIEAFSKAIELYPDYTFAYNQRGWAHSQKGDWQNALTDYDKEVSLLPDNPQALNNRGSAYQQLRYFDEALADYSKALQIDPYYTELYINRGLIYTDRGLLDEALNDFNVALQLVPGHAWAYNGRGRVYARKNELDKAISDFSNAIKGYGYFAAAYGDRGNVYMAKGEFDLAVEDFTKMIEIEPNDLYGYYYRANAYAAKGDFRKAAADGEAVLKMNPDPYWAGELQPLLQEWKNRIK